jgi:AraC-like DNA-binding protein
MRAATLTPAPERGEAVTGQIAEAGDLDSVLSLLSGMRGAVRVRILGDQVGMRVAHNAVGPVGIDHMSFRMDLDADIGRVGMLVFGQVNSGTVGFRGDGAERWYASGDVYLAGQPLQGRTSMFRGGEHDQLVIDPAYLSQVAETAPGRAPTAVRFTGYEAVSAQAARMWKSSYAYVRDMALVRLGVADAPLVAANMARLLAATALATFPNSALTEPTVQDQRDGSPATLRRAVAFIDEHAHEDISTADIAAAAYVTIRAVQLAFRRHLNCTPTAYLRRVRLDHAHRQLMAADPQRESVTAVAYRWGFTNLSRFAAAYREAYGILPSHTLHD